jgi:tight adherence protein B
MTAAGSLLGLAVGLGLLLLVDGVRPTTPKPGVKRSAFRIEQLWLRAGAALGGAALLWVITGWPVGGGAGFALGWFVPRMLGASRRRRRMTTERIAALATWTEMLRDGFAAGSLLTSTLRSTEAAAPDAIAPEVWRLCQRIRRPRPDAVEHGLRAFAEELADPTADTIVTALMLAARGRAANLSDLLGTLAASARAEVTMRLEVEAKRAEILMQRRLIIGVVTALCGYLFLLRRNYLAPFATLPGQCVAAGIVAVFALSLWSIDRLSRLETPQRQGGERTAP